MKLDCLAFRALLEQELTGRPDPRSLTSLSWHGHLLACGACRTLFEREEALEALLASWPEPRLSPELKQRVLVALARSRADRSLDDLLERADRHTSPAGLARRVLAGLESQRAAGARAEDPLDRLLERASAVDVPDHLARRVLAGLATERAPARRPILALRRTTWLAAAAAVLVVSLVVWIASRRSGTDEPPRVVVEPRASDPAPAPDAKMLAAFEVLENWDLLMQPDDVDPLLATIPTADEVLLDFQDEG